MVLEVHGGGLAARLVDGGLGDQAEDGEAIVGAVGSLRKAGLGVTAGLRVRGESVEKALREKL